MCDECVCKSGVRPSVRPSVPGLPARRGVLPLSHFRGHSSAYHNDMLLLSHGMDAARGASCCNVCEGRKGIRLNVKCAFSHSTDCFFLPSSLISVCVPLESPQMTATNLSRRRLANPISLPGRSHSAYYWLSYSRRNEVGSPCICWTFHYCLHRG